MRGGVDITSNFNDRTTQIKIESIAGNGEGDHCVISLDDRDWRIVAIEPGETIGVYLGYQEIGLAYMGTFELDEVTYQGKPRVVQLTGTSTGFMNVQKAPAIKEFDNKSISDILGGMAGQTGLGLSIDKGLGDITLPFKNQVVSNLHMIHELERLTGAMAKIADGKLVFVPRDSTESVSGLPIPTIVLLPEHFGDWSVRYSGRPDFGSVKAAWHDKDDMVRRWVDFGSQGGAVGNGSGGAYVLGQVFNSMQEAQAATQSKMQALNRAQVQATFDLAKGDPWIHSTSTLLVEGMRDKINGSYVVEKATHTYIKSTGIRTNLDCRAPGNGSDFSDRAPDEFLRPQPGETIGDLLAAGFDVPKDILQISPP
jgi:uncharacterized protein